MKENFIKNLRTYIITLTISLFVGIVIFLVYFLVNDATMYAAINASSLSAVILLSLGGLMWVSSEGFFDIFSYGFRQLFGAMFSKKANQDNDYSAYMEDKRIKRKAQPKIFLSVLVSGLILLIVMIVLRIVEICA